MSLEIQTTWNKALMVCRVVITDQASWLAQ
jgi:hypothetical protein